MLLGEGHPSPTLHGICWARFCRTVALNQKADLQNYNPGKVLFATCCIPVACVIPKFRQQNFLREFHATVCFEFELHGCSRQSASICVRSLAWTLYCYCWHFYFPTSNFYCP